MLVYTHVFTDADHNFSSISLGEGQEDNSNNTVTQEAENVDELSFKIII
jgi:hypothetical protein